MLGGAEIGYFPPQVEIVGESHQNHSQFTEDSNFARFDTQNLVLAPMEDQEPSSSSNKRRYHRHTAEQIDYLEEFFKKCPHPDTEQRKAVSSDIGLEPLKVKFWFQNKRNQVKCQLERQENLQMRGQNDKLRAENSRLREIIRSCPNCERAIATMGEMFNEQTGTTSTIFTTRDKLETPVVFGIAATAMEELLEMAEAGQPLWHPGYDTTDLLNKEEYLRAFPKGDGSRALGWSTEATRETAEVNMNCKSLVEMMMDVNQWFVVFSNIVSKVVPVNVMVTRVGGDYDGALQVMRTVHHFPSPLVPIREYFFARYCKKGQDGTWAIVDASIDGLRPNSSTICRRWPSGCLIKALPNGNSKVIWIEHVEIEDSSIHVRFKHLINSGLAFGAKRWVSILNQQCLRSTSVIVPKFPSDIKQEGWYSLMKLAERMRYKFCTSITSTDNKNSRIVSDLSKGDIKITLRNVNDRGRSLGAVINVVASLWLPINPSKLFGFLSNVAFRKEWDVLNGDANEVAHLNINRDQNFCISLLTGQGKLLLQESSFNMTGSYVVHEPFDTAFLKFVLNGGNSEGMSIHPSGFAILPDGPSALNGVAGERGTGGSILTIGFQHPVDIPEKCDLDRMNNLISSTVAKIKAACVLFN